MLKAVLAMERECGCSCSICSCREHLGATTAHKSIIQGTKDIVPVYRSKWDKLEGLVESLQRTADFPTILTTRMLRRGQHLYRPGGALKHVYSIRQGTLKTYRTGPDGRERISGFFSAGQLLGLDALADRPSRCGAVALDTCVLGQIPVLAIRQGMDKSSELRHQVLEALHGEIARLEHQLAVCRLPAAQRLAGFILSMIDPSGEVYLPMSHREIANFLSLVPETVSRLCTKFCERKWVSMRGRVVLICDRSALEQAAAGPTLP